MNLLSNLSKADCYRIIYILMENEKQEKGENSGGRERERERERERVVGRDNGERVF